VRGRQVEVACTRCGKRNRVPDAAPGKPRCGNCQAWLPWITDAGDDDFHDVVEASPLPVLVDLWAPWCGPCRMVSPAVEGLGRDFAGRVKVVKVNVDEAPAVASRFGVQGIPTLLVVDGGAVRRRQTGAAPEPVLRQWLTEALGSPGAGGS
jgi:thioredoxin 2